ncbi:hypothetical protein ABZ461_29565 [Actinacidiphila glaucinigra]|uniref:hypothetical protein n=1 Tax=Actinacidiphila glaucinigra TaxID=235986 RepID=UPI0033DDD7D7
MAKRQSDTAETLLLNQRAPLSADERERIAEEFADEVFEGLDAGPDIESRMRRTPADLSEDPTPNRWTPGWNPPYNAAQHPAPGASVWFARKVAGLVGLDAPARESGVAPDAPGPEPSRARSWTRTRTAPPCRPVWGRARTDVRSATGSRRRCSAASRRAPRTWPNSVGRPRP